MDDCLVDEFVSGEPNYFGPALDVGLRVKPLEA